MPMYIIYLNEKSWGGDGFRVSHPNYKNKKFMSKKLSIGEKLKLSIEHLNEISS